MPALPLEDWTSPVLPALCLTACVPGCAGVRYSKQVLSSELSSGGGGSQLAPPSRAHRPRPCFSRPRPPPCPDAHLVCSRRSQVRAEFGLRGAPRSQMGPGEPPLARPCAPCDRARPKSTSMLVRSPPLPPLAHRAQRTCPTHPHPILAPHAAQVALVARAAGDDVDAFWLSMLMDEWGFGRAGRENPALCLLLVVCLSPRVRGKLAGCVGQCACCVCVGPQSPLDMYSYNSSQSGCVVKNGVGLIFNFTISDPTCGLATWE